MHTSLPQSWLTTSHVFTATAGTAGRWDYFKARKSFSGCGGEVTADGFYRWCALSNHYVSQIFIFNSPFLLTSPVPEPSFASLRFLSHFRFTYLFQSLCARSWFKFTHACLGCAHVSRRVKVQGAAIHETSAWGAHSDLGLLSHPVCLSTGLYGPARTS